MLVFLLACGQFGLTPENEVVVASNSDTGQDWGNNGGNQNGNDDEVVTASDDDDPVAVSLVGNTWSVDLDEVTITEPAGMQGMLALMESTILLFHASKQGTKSLDLVVALASPNGDQNPCERVQDLPAANWKNPVFAIEQGQLDITISGESVAFKDTLLSAIVDTDGEGWHDGILTSRLDAREFAAALPDGTDVCGLVKSMGGACSACPDGEEQCFDLVIEDITAIPAGGDFDPTPSGC